ncbi:MAG: tyrosine-protein phosphatase [Candidatus Acidiferrales bacterium]
MIDIHCHILHGLDDGPDSLDLSVEMAQMAIEEGITHIIATPHANDRYVFDPDLIEERRQELQSRMGDKITIATGCDFHLSFENLRSIRTELTRFTLNQKRYLLVEFADYAIPPGVEQTLHELQLSGLRPIITHPERNPLIRAQQDRLLRWMRLGCYVQITASSFTGRFGPPARECAERWLDMDIVHFIATDAHNVTSRPPRFGEAWAKVAERRGEEVARALFEENPRAALESRILPYAPDPPDPEPDARDAALPPRRKRFWFF